MAIQIECPKCKRYRGLYINSINDFTYWLKCSVCGWESREYPTEKECIDSLIKGEKNTDES